MVKKWQNVLSEDIGTFRIFKIRKDTSVSPRTGKQHGFYVIDSDDWINIIPVTPEGRVVLIHQYRHGNRELTLEIPGGVIDPEDASPAAAARREMIEETGYDSDDIIPLGVVSPNPAILNNRCHTFLARNVLPGKPQSFDSAEDIAVELFDLSAIADMIRTGKICHALVVAAFYHYDHYRLQNP